MKVVLQRVDRASVKISGTICGQIDTGYVILLGIGEGDTKDTARQMAEKIKKLRLFEDSEGKTNLSIEQVNGKVLVISQFTLYANTKKGTRPSFIEAANPDVAEEIYNYFLCCCKEIFGDVQHGEFGADMKVELINNGPFTIILDSQN